MRAERWRVAAVPEIVLREYRNGVEVWIRPESTGSYVDGGRGLIGGGHRKEVALVNAIANLEQVVARLRRMREALP